ncbi:MAG TPA: helix-hairpin-helix domain-containing protein [Flavobacterium sp.]|nr:helix-hairpin-helix domain-containing protein [Flavobacterium sp.]
MKTKNIFTHLAIALCFASSAQMRVHQINVGQGCATLIEFPCAAILVDTGGESNGYYNAPSALQAYLEDFFDRRRDLNHTLQCVYLTHPHKDHTLGVPVILQPPYVIKNVVTDGLERGSGKSGQMKLHQLAQNSETNTSTSDDVGLEAVYVSEIGTNGFSNGIIDPVNCNGINPDIRILWGASATNPGWSNATFDNENNHSLVIKITYGQSTFLIIGDLEDDVQDDLVAKYGSSNTLDSDVYLVGHHGSKNGTTAVLLNKITPKIALIGVGAEQRQTNWTAWAYGHPNKGILQMLQDRLTTARTPFHIKAGTGAKTFVDYVISKGIYATAWDDNIVLETSGDKMWRKVDVNNLGVTEAALVAMVPEPINLNTASAAELEILPGIGAVKAQEIVNYRSTNGNFATVEQLDNVPGIGRATIDLVKPYAKI